MTKTIHYIGNGKKILNRVEFQRYNSFFKDSSFSLFYQFIYFVIQFYSLSIAKLKFDELLDVIYKVEFDFLYFSSNVKKNNR